MSRSEQIGDLAAATDLEAAPRDLARRDAVEVPPCPAITLRVTALVAGGDHALAGLARSVASFERPPRPDDVSLVAP